jgi:hypothetical protein
LVDDAKAVGCGPELLRTYVLYAEGNDQSIGLGHINSDGTVTIWGSASRDDQIGRQAGLEYMKAVASLLPSADVKDSFADRRNWYFRFNGRSSIPLRDLLQCKAEWVAAMAQVVQALGKTHHEDMAFELVGLCFGVVCRHARDRQTIAGLTGLVLTRRAGAESVSLFRT